MTMPTDKPYAPLPPRTNNEHRRTSKPLMEKRRRARINQSLSELKALILDAVKKENQHTSRHSKLEKADILEMTVRHLQNLHRQRAIASDPLSISKFRAGYSECAREVSSFVGRLEGTDPVLRSRIIDHISGCVSTLNELDSPLSPPRPSSNESCSSGCGAGNLQVCVEMPSASSSSSSPPPSPTDNSKFPVTSCPVLVASADSSRNFGLLLTAAAVPRHANNAVPVISRTGGHAPGGHFPALVVPYDLAPSSPLNLVTKVHRDDDEAVSSTRSSSSPSSRSCPATPVNCDSQHAKEYHSDSELSIHGGDRRRIAMVTSDSASAFRCSEVDTKPSDTAKQQEAREQRADCVWRPW